MRKVKNALRQELKEKRRGFNKTEKDIIIFEKLIALPQFVNAESVLTYASMPIEVDTSRLIEFCRNNNTPVATPEIENNTMRFVPEVDLSNSVCIVPALAYNTENYRLGFGGGYYDRFLKDYKGISIGLCYREFITEIPVEEHDVPVDIVLTD
ncbi:MAG: 5-formyltetrahydrofolate cyclo-ligase [Oscillospiraceae bacterium]|nr:5-formyltetrahydrofolate cyclo-ligase [Oscillospiraceae bacterium]